jgi:hypothetical protein
MAVYVDSMFAPYRGMKMCHMVADSRQELLDMVDKIGVDRKWIQNKGTPREHFDIAASKRKLAVSFGAVEVTRRELGQILRKKREVA